MNRSWRQNEKNNIEQHKTWKYWAADSPVSLIEPLDLVMDIFSIIGL